MVKLGLLMISCTGIAVASGCVADSADVDADQTQALEAELAASPDGPVTNAFGNDYHPIRLSNTTLCLQPLNGTTGDAVVELRTCTGSWAQHWRFSQKTFGEWEIINLQSQKCLYNDVSVLFNGAQPIIQGDCNVFGTSTPASNALWSTGTWGNTAFRSMLGHRDTGFCVDVPGIPFDGIQTRNFRCNGTPPQIFVVGMD